MKTPTRNKSVYSTLSEFAWYIPDKILSVKYLLLFWHNGSHHIVESKQDS